VAGSSTRDALEHGSERERPRVAATTGAWATTHKERLAMAGHDSNAHRPKCLGCLKCRLLFTVDYFAMDEGPVCPACGGELLHLDDGDDTDACWRPDTVTFDDWLQEPGQLALTQAFFATLGSRHDIAAHLEEFRNVMLVEFIDGPDQGAPQRDAQHSDHAPDQDDDDDG
jgi:hypothetical protein